MKPLLTRLSIRNFKGIGDDWVDVPLCPITLLFGANSAGKSTILHALHYAREIFERHNLDADRTLAGGEFVDLGGFENFVHGHDKSLAVGLAFGIDLRGRQMPDYLPNRDDLIDADRSLPDVGHTMHSATVQIAIECGSLETRPAVTRYAVKINGEALASISFSPDRGRSLCIDFLNARHPVFHPGLFGDDNADPNWSIMDDLYQSIFDEIPRQEQNLVLTGQLDAMPTWGKPLSIDLPNRPLSKRQPRLFKEAEPDHQRELDFIENEQERHLFRNYLSLLLLAPGELIRKALRDMRYLGPLRQLPGRNHHPPRYTDSGRWAGGLAAWDLIFWNSTLRAECNRWLTAEDRLNIGCSAQVREYLELKPDERLMLDAIVSQYADRDAPDLMHECAAILDNVPNGRRLFISDEASHLELAPPDLGVGIAQIIPVVVAAVEQTEALTLIEQPELHLHPALQANLAEVFIARANLGLGPVILETHSEHLILRILRRIRETHEGDLPEGHPGLVPNLVSVIYVGKQDGQIGASQLRIDETGEFRDRWPKGFFEERAEELF